MNISDACTHPHPPADRLGSPDLGQYLFCDYRIPSTQPAFDCHRIAGIAGRLAAVTVDVRTTGTPRLGKSFGVVHTQYRLFSGHVVCGGLSPAGRVGRDFKLRPNPNGAGMDGSYRQQAAENDMGCGSLRSGGVILMVASQQARFDTLGIAAALAGAVSAASGIF